MGKSCGGVRPRVDRLSYPSLARNPNYFSGHLRLASLLGLEGQLDKAKKHAQEALRINPGFNASAVKSFYKTEDQAALASFVDGLKKAGMTFDGNGSAA